MKNPITIIAVSALLIVVIGSGLGIMLYMQFRPNSRFFILDNIRLGARLDGRQASYGAIVIGNADVPYSGTLGLSFRCGDIQIDFDQMTAEQLAQMATLVKSANHESIAGGPWPDDAKRLFLCRSAIEVVVFDGVILQVNANPRRAVGSAREPDWMQIRTDRSSTWISVPFSDSDAVRLFGTPDRTTDTFIH